MSSLAEVITGMSAGRVLVLGDMVADEYLVGRPVRISREAPVLILHYVESFVRPAAPPILPITWSVSAPARHWWASWATTRWAGACGENWN